MTPVLTDFSRTAARSEQLVAASERTTHDPFREIDWNTPVDAAAYHLPPELLSLYGTAVWDSMSDSERKLYSLHEATALAGAGIWFENALMQVVLRHLADIEVTSPMHRYLLVEVADECRHSTMFGEYIRRSGTPAYRPQRQVVVDETSGGRALSYLLILAIEELLDFANRATMRDDRVHPTARQVAKLHVLEEARHVSFARSYLAEVWPTLSDDDRATVIEAAPILVGEIVSLNLDPAVFEHLGIDDGYEIARQNPHYRGNLVAGLAKLTSFLAEVGVIDADHRQQWIELGLLAEC